MPEAQQPRQHKRRPRNKNRRRKGGFSAQSAKTLHDILSRPKEQPLDENEQKIIKKHLVFFKKYRAQLKLKYNAAEDLWVNGVKEPEDRGGCKHLFNKLDRQVIEAALQRGNLSEMGESRLQFLQGAASILQEVSIWIAYMKCLKETRSQSLLETFERISTWMDFRAISPSQLLRFVTFFWEAFAGPTRLSLFFRLMDDRTFREVTRGIVSESEQASEDIKSSWAIYGSLWSTNSASGPVTSETTERLLVWFKMDRSQKGVIPDRTKDKMGRWLLRHAPTSFSDEQLWEQLFSCWTKDGGQDCLWDLSELAMAQARYDRAQRALQKIKPPLRYAKEAQYLLRMLERERVGPFAVKEPMPQKSYVGEAFWLTKRLQVHLRVMSMSAQNSVKHMTGIQSQLPGIFDVVNCRGFDQGALCVASVLKGWPLPDFVAKEKRLAPDNVLALWLQGMRLLKQIAGHQETMQPFEPHQWYAEFNHHGGNLHLAFLESPPNDSVSIEDVQNQMNAYFVGILEKQFPESVVTKAFQLQMLTALSWKELHDRVHENYVVALGLKRRR
ncbi:MAG: hypothetical protein CMH56_14945 [Myxococcales bacterium]|nr:hypothetical protein [Myxococcales bacterium]